MAKGNSDAVIAGIEKMVTFLIAWGDGKAGRIAKYREFLTRIKEAGLKKDLVRELDQFRNDNFLEIREEIWGGHVLAGRDDEETIDQLEQASGAIYNGLYPLDIPQTVDISGFAGSEYVDEKRVDCPGDPTSARELVEQTIAFVRRYSQVVANEDYDGAYAMAERGLRAMMKPSVFARKYREAASRWGRLREFHMQRFTSILTDAAARENDSSKQWKSLTPKQNRRAHILGYWINDAQNGPGGALWIAEEDGQYRLANFKFWVWKG
jgi:hypothetical protein